MSERPFPAPTSDADVADLPASPISLADVIGLGVVPYWTEAVAVVEELCEVLAATEGEILVPELPDVAITSRGVVMVRRGARGSADVHELGHLLYLLLHAGTAPMALRLFAVHAMNAGMHTTVGAFAEALGYYSQPGRRELIRALYDRCLHVPPDGASPPDGSVNPRGPVTPASWRARFSRFRRLVVICALCAGAAGWAAGDSRRSPYPAAAVERVPDASPALTDPLRRPSR